MATYTELHTLATSQASALQQRIGVALTIRAYAYVTAQSPTAAQLDWAKACLARPEDYSGIVLRAALAANKDLTVAQIQGATDAGLQTVVDNVVNTLLAR